MQEKYDITDAELEIMQVLWKKKQCNLMTIIEELSNNEEKNKNTIKTLIHRLVQNGVRIDIWTHFMRGCIIELCTLH